MKKGEEIRPLILEVAKQITATLLVGLFLLPLAGAAKAASLNDLKQQKQDISKKITEDSKTAKQKQTEKKELEALISGLSRQINETEKKITDTQGKISQTQSAIAEIGGQISQKEQELVREQDKKKETLIAMYQSSQKSFFTMVLTSNSLSEVSSNADMIDALETKIETTIAEIQRLKAELEGQKREQEAKKVEFEKLKSQQQNYQVALDGQKAAKNRALTDTKSVIQDLEAQIADAKKRQSQVDSQISAIIAAQSKNNNRGIIARDRGTSAVGLQWPIDYIYISQGFSDPWIFNPSRPHGGLDLVNASGTPVYSSAGGTVLWAGSLGNYGYGRYVIIGHNARFTTLYGHLGNIAVSAGDEVKQGELIGDLTGDPSVAGYWTGPHSHFEVYENGSRVDPLGYLP